MNFSLHQFYYKKLRYFTGFYKLIFYKRRFICANKSSYFGNIKKADKKTFGNDIFRMPLSFYLTKMQMSNNILIVK